MNIHKGEKGLTLAEIVIAVFLITVAFLSIIGVFTAGLQSIQKSKNYATACTLAQSKLNKIEALSYSEIVDSVPPVNNETSGNFIIDVILQEFTYPSSTLKYKQVTIEVYNTDNIDARKSTNVRVEAIIPEEE